MIGRVLPELGRGPWWEYLRVVRSFIQAALIARELSAVVGSNIWFQESQDRYYAIPRDASERIDFTP